MTFTGVNYLAVLVAGVVGWLVGAGYYMALGDQWMRAHEWSAERIAQMKSGQGHTSKAPFVIAFVSLLVMAWVLAGMMAHFGPGQVTLRNGIISGAFAWLGFVVTTIAVNYSFGGRRATLIGIDSGHWLLVLMVQGAIIGAFGR
jgi:hypothetical protein